MIDVQYHPEFSEDLAAAATYLQNEQHGLGERFLDEAEKACREILDGPLLNSYIDRPIRRRLVKPFLYAVHYELIAEDQLFIYGCYHCAVNPERWKHRYESTD